MNNAGSCVNIDEGCSPLDDIYDSLGVHVISRIIYGRLSVHAILRILLPPPRKEKPDRRGVEYELIGVIIE